ncbi:hypothetical protein [Microbacterium sp.]|uniref:hypothetical protein n=1 Tax=Microbacterium sp. TaxID=51671 RepID=UPI00260448EF|nr:hypothetical protein [Microbacterium sp.]
MRWVALISTAFLLAVPQIGPPGMVKFCTVLERVTGKCSTHATTNDTDVVVDSIRHENSNLDDSLSLSEWLQDLFPPKPPTRDAVFADCLADWDDGRSCFLPLEDTEDEDDTVEIPAVTITDVAHFAPDGPALTGEPSNVGVAGLPTNFVATASAHTVDGEIFDFPVTVRFTPAGFDFAYGDGETTTTTTGGKTWHALGQAQFTPTATSHTYTERGTYTAHVDVRYTAEVDFGIGWIPLTGEVTATGPDQQIRIYEAHTALVAHTCHEDPTGPGC